ncbi:MAG: Crp/Fnr family transcriptional regulator [Pyrinomonadaceae bacterium]
MQFQEEGSSSISIDGLVTVDQLLGNISASTQAAFAKIRGIRLFRAGETIFNIGEPANKIYVHLAGHIDHTSARMPIILDQAALSGEQKIFGLIETLAGQPYSYDLKAVTECTLGVIDHTDLSAFLLSNPAVSYHLAEHLSRCYREVIQRLENFCT